MTEINTVKPMTPEQIKVVAFIEKHWYQQSSFPSKRDIELRFPDFDINESLKHATFRRALNNRGIEAPRAMNTTVPVDITDEQFAAISTILNWDDRRSRVAKLKDLGITTLKWQGWMKQPNFLKFLQELSGANFDAVINVAHEGLMKAIDRGDTGAVKLYMELTGRYQAADSNNMQNIKVIIAQITEIIQNRVKDPETLRLIAQDFAMIEEGKPVQIISHRELGAAI